MEAAGTSIDWLKTWFWTTCNRHPSSIRDIVQQCVPGQSIQQKTSATDLGFQLQYSGNNSLGIITSRLQKGFDTLRRLQAMPRMLSIKESMLRTSVYPATLHGSEIKPLSTEHVQQLRTRAARALFGNNSSMSPVLALTLTTGGILDPEFWLLAKSLCTARAFLLNQSPTVQRNFFHMCSRFQGTLSQVCGPASALAFMLGQISLQIDAEGFLHATAFLKFHVLCVSQKRLVRCLQEAWMDRLAVVHTARYKWFQYRDIARDETVQVINKFADAKRWMILREIAGAYQVASRKQKWLSHVSSQCPHCGQDDSRYHRLVECALGSDVRQPYLTKLQELELSESLLTRYPVITIHPSAEAIQLMLFNLPDAVWDASILRLVHSRRERQEIVHWFTDGSYCMFPNHVGSRFSAYTVVLDLCESDQERAIIAEQFRHNHRMAPSLQVACAARRQGEQDILRAETYAIVSISENVGYGVIHSDSQTAISNVQRALGATSPRDLASCENMDLLLRLWNIRHNLGITLEKVKAHQAIPTISDELQRYWLWVMTLLTVQLNMLVNISCRTWCKLCEQNILRFQVSRKTWKPFFACIWNCRRCGLRQHNKPVRDNKLCNMIIVPSAKHTVTGMSPIHLILLAKGIYSF